MEYLLVPIPAAFASDFHYTFKSNTQMESFPVENRDNIGQRQVKGTGHFYLIGINKILKINLFLTHSDYIKIIASKHLDPPYNYILVSA